MVLRKASRSAVVRTYCVQPGLRLGLWNVSERVRTPSATSVSVTATISSNVLPSGDSMILLSAPVRASTPTALSGCSHDADATR